MRDPLAARRRHAARYLLRHVEQPVQRQRPLAQALAQRLALQQLGHQVAAPLVQAEVVHREDRRMIERRGRAGLVLEAQHARAVLPNLLGQYLDRDLAAEAVIVGPVDLPHSAGPEQAGQLLTAETRTGRSCIERGLGAAMIGARG